MTAMGIEQPERRRASAWQVARAVLSGFFGVRKRADHEAVKVTPGQVIVTGIIAAALFVTGLLLLVNFILSRAGAGG